jgi:hypothetical protein
MSDLRKNDHPDLFELAAFAEGSLGEAAAASVGHHVAECAICALEIRKMKRFEGIEADQELLAASHWDEADTELEARFAENIRPGIEKPVSKSPKRISWRWAASFAAAAVVLVILFPGLSTMSDGPGEGPSPMRGGEEKVAVLQASAPLGELVGPPEFFAWKTDIEFDSFSLRIFSPELESVFEKSGITAQKLAVKDTLLASLRPGKVYLWTVTGHTGLEPEAASDPARFHIMEFPPQK